MRIGEAKMSIGSSVTNKIIIAFLSTSLLILVILLIISLTCSRQKKSVESEDNLPIQSQKVSAHSYPLVDLDIATDGFNPRRVIGKGRLGTVYYASMDSSSSSSSSTIGHRNDIIALKRINPCFVLSNAGFGFSKTIKSLSLAHHPNILPILGFSEAPGERIILTEFMGMKSLDFHLHQNLSSTGATSLDWRNRLRIAAGAARGIEYLHEGMVPYVVHGCIKPSNILIDGDFRARVSDYGLSFLAPQEVRGIKGYVDREFLFEKGGFSKENDVYGFGVVLLEILSGRRCDEHGFFVEWALSLIKDDSRIVEVFDPRVLAPLDLKPLVRLVKVASACVSNTRKNRPSIAQVAAILTNLELHYEYLKGSMTSFMAANLEKL